MNKNEISKIEDKKSGEDISLESIECLFKTISEINENVNEEITREELLEQIAYQENIQEDEEIVNFIPPHLLHAYWRRFGGIFLQKKNKLNNTMDVIYKNPHLLYKRVNTDITNLSVLQITQIIKTGLDLSIDLFTSVNQKAVSIKWREKERHIPD